MSFERTPPDFMKDVFISPHNFNDPQNAEHGNYVNMQMKNDLYNNVLYQITACQFSFFGEAQEQLSVESIKKCEGPDPVNGYASKLVNKDAEEKELLSCQDWDISLSKALYNKKKSKYRVKIYQTRRDIFYPEIHPPTYWKLFKYYLFN